MSKLIVIFLRIGVAIPVLYYLSVIIGSLFYPGYNHITQYASELGSASALYPVIFNAGIIAMGAVSMVAAWGFGATLIVMGRNRVLSVFSSILMALFGVSMIMGGSFPMPDERHGGYGLGLGIHLVPFLLVGMLWSLRPYRSLVIFLIINAVFMELMFAIMMGAGGLVTLKNVGLFQRLYSLTAFPWIGIVYYVLAVKNAPKMLAGS